MKRIVLLSLFFVICSSIWAGFNLENFDNAASWPGTTDYTGTATFNGNDWTWYRVSQYQSGSDYEMEILGYQSGKITSYYFENGAGTLYFNASYISNSGSTIHVYYSSNGTDWTNAAYRKAINTSSSSSYSVAINNSQAHYVRIQADYYSVRIDDISVSNELAPVVPTVTVASISNVTKFTAQGGGNVTDDGGASVTVRGVCWGLSQSPSLADDFTEDGSGTGSFTSQITGLAANTDYFVRAYATNSAGTGYSEYNFPATFTTTDYAPTSVTDDASDLNNVFANLNGTVNCDEAETTVIFEYGLDTNYGSTVTADESPLSGDSDQSVQASLHELNENTTYHYRVKATNTVNSVDTYGGDKTFTTTNNPNQTSTQSIPAATPDPDPIDFTGTGVSIDFSGVSGATGTDDVTVDQFNEPPTNLTGLIGSEVRISGSSYLFTNLTGFTFTSSVQFLISEISGLNTSLFDDMDDATETTLKMWKRPEYGTGDFIDQGFLLYDDGADNINGTADDFLYLAGINDFSEFAFSSDGDHPLPVTLSSFYVSFDNDENTINWTTQSETNNLGWNLYRSENEAGWVQNDLIQINADLIPGMGTTTEPTEYSFVDEYIVIENHTYYYWLQSISFTQEFQLYGPISIEIPNPGEIPEFHGTTALAGNYPNPFNPITNFKFTIGEGQSGYLSIFNIKGEKLFKQAFEEGYHNFSWNADNFPSGIYFYKLTSDYFSQTKKMILLK